ncbi:MAG: HD-like signal output (HDOD) protein [Methylophagaceae bacterium]|jgi:HD-like signal output (HDOD) protein
MEFTADALINKSLELVSPPTTYTQLDALIHDDSASADDISQVINADPALTTRLLRIVNSPYYGFPSQISTISRAIAIVGTSELAQLVLATSVINSFRGIPEDLIKMTDFWRHSIACAITASIIAKKCKMQVPEQFFIAGLLQNIGSLVIYQTIPELAREAITSSLFGNETLYESERRLLSFDHTEVGEALAKKWRLPAALTEIIRYHHTPSQTKLFPIETAIVHLADVMVTAAGIFGHSGDRHVPKLDHQAWQELKLDEQQLPDIMQQVKDKIDDLASMLATA